MDFSKTLIILIYTKFEFKAAFSLHEELLAQLRTFSSAKPITRILYNDMKPNGIGFAELKVRGKDIIHTNFGSSVFNLMQIYIKSLDL